MKLKVYLAGDVLIGKTNNQPVLRCIVLIFVLDGESLSGIVISFSLTTPLEFNLVPFKVLFVFHYLNETLFSKKSKILVLKNKIHKVIAIKIVANQFEIH